MLDTIYILAAMLKISKSGHHFLDIQWHTLTIRAPVGANKKATKIEN